MRTLSVFASTIAPTLELSSGYAPDRPKPRSKCAILSLVWEEATPVRGYRQ